MSVLLVDFIANHEIREIETLEVTFWCSERWHAMHSFALMMICKDLKVKKLNFWADAPFTAASCLYYSALESYLGDKRMIPNDLPHLREINIVINNMMHPALWRDIFYKGHIRKISWKVTKLIFAVSIFDTVLDQISLENNFCLRELYFSTEYEEAVLFNQNSCKDLNLTHMNEGTLMANCLSRNCRAFEKCQKAVIILLKLSKRKSERLFSLISHNVSRIMINMVWDTRGTKIWAE
jgi:hypothetical protein